MIRNTCFEHVKNLYIYRNSNHITTFHKRPLPQALIALSSTKGKEYFRDALAEGYMESFFPLSEQFITQSEPSFCSLSSLAMVLNALNHDPKKIWKGVWRWVTEEMLQCDSMKICGHSLENVKQDGMDFNTFENLARCHGVNIVSCQADDKKHATGCSSIIQFRNHVKQACSNPLNDTFIVTNFSRKSIGQTGDGHFSPIGGYFPSKDLILILDVARFKYPPFWIPLPDLWQSMIINDKKTQSPRGYFIISDWKKDINHTTIGTETSMINNQQCPPIIRAWNDSQLLHNKSHCCLNEVEREEKKKVA